MRVKKISYEDSEAYLIFITPGERENTQIKNQIEYYRTLSKNTAVFVSGNKSLEQALKDLKAIGN